MEREARQGLAAWQIAGLAAAGSVGALALANQVVRLGVGPAQSVLPGEQERFAWTHGDIFYTVRGRGAPLILIHGVYAGASSFEFRRIFEPLSERFRVYAFDLLGFGLSARPSLVYTPDLYTDLILDFTRQVVGGADQPARVVASTLGCAFLVRAVAERPALFDRLVLIEPTGYEDLAGDPDEPLHRIQRGVLRTPLLGQGIYNLIASRPSIRFFLRQTYGRDVPISDDLVDYYHTQAHQKGARYAPASFLSGALDTPVGEYYPAIDQPILLVWGKNATFTPLENARAFRQHNPHADLRVYDCGSLPQAEVASEFVSDVGAWLAAGSPASR